MKKIGGEIHIYYEHIVEAQLLKDDVPSVELRKKVEDQ